MWQGKDAKLRVQNRIKVKRDTIDSIQNMKNYLGVLISETKNKDKEKKGILIILQELFFQDSRQFELTFKSPAATLNASSITQPAACRQKIINHSFIVTIFYILEFRSIQLVK